MFTGLRTIQLPSVAGAATNKPEPPRNVEVPFKSGVAMHVISKSRDLETVMLISAYQIKGDLLLSRTLFIFAICEEVGSH